MHNSILLAKENKELRAENEKKKQKRTRSRRQIPAEAGLSVQEASQLITERVEAIEAPSQGAGINGELALQPRTRSLRACGICRLPGHRRETCPDRSIS